MPGVHYHHRETGNYPMIYSKEERNDTTKEVRMDLIYPEHKHPHGIENVSPDEYRIWVCEECCHIFTDGEIREDAPQGWGHACKSHPCRKGQRCESHLEPYRPDRKAGLTLLTGKKTAWTFAVSAMSLFLSGMVMLTLLSLAVIIGIYLTAVTLYSIK